MFSVLLFSNGAKLNRVIDLFLCVAIVITVLCFQPSIFSVACNVLLVWFL